MFKNKSVQRVVDKVTARIAPIGGYAVKGAGALARTTKAVGNNVNAGIKAGAKGALRGPGIARGVGKLLKEKKLKIK